MMTHHSKQAGNRTSLCGQSFFFAVAAVNILLAIVCSPLLSATGQNVDEEPPPSVDEEAVSDEGVETAPEETEKTTQSFELSHRQFDEMREILEPFLDDDDLLLGHGSTLVVRADAGRIEALEALVDALDTLRESFRVDIRRRMTVWPGRRAIARATDAPPPRSVRLSEGAKATVTLGRERYATSLVGRTRRGRILQMEPQTEIELLTITLKSVSDNNAELHIVHNVTRFEGRDLRRGEQADLQVTVPLESWTKISGLYTGPDEEAGRRIIAATGGGEHPELEIRVTPISDPAP